MNERSPIKPLTPKTPLDFDRAIGLLQAIDMEWRTDPMSVQCFDERLRANVSDLLKEYDTRGFKS